MMVSGCFVHFAITETGIVESVCLVCGRCTGYSPNEQALSIAEKAHKCELPDSAGGAEQTNP